MPVRMLLTDEAWGEMAPLLSAIQHKAWSPPELSDRQFSEAVRSLARTGLPWRDLPNQFGHWDAVEFISIYDMLCLQRKEATAMGHVRFTALQTRPLEVLDLTSLTLDEFRRLVPPFEAAFQAHMAQWRFDGQPRTARRYTTYKSCPLPTPEDRLLLILTYLKTYPLQVVQGRLFGMDQSKANQWIHVLLVVLQATLRTLEDAPSRALQALAQRLGVTEAEAAALVVPSAELSSPGEPPLAAPPPAPPSPLSAMMGRSDGSRAPRTRLSRRAVIAVRKHATP
jgi:Putative transposase of IS4/5 family (DUF4096)/Helix-turn-helix of DDE superfamily endonuclease